jgi:hypothetical protein
MVLMVVIVTGASHWQRRSLTALSWCEEPDRIDLTAIWRRRIGATGDVVRLRVVVGERDPLPDRDDQLTRIGAGR